MAHKIRVTFKIPIYFGTVTVYAGYPMEELIKRYNLEANNPEALAFSITNEKGYTRYYMIFNYDAEITVVAHECYHTVNNILQDRGVYLSAGNDEPGAYLMGWLMGKTLKLFKPKLSKK